MRDYIRFVILSCRDPLDAVTLHLTNESLYNKSFRTAVPAAEVRTKRGEAFLSTPMNKKLPKLC